MSSADPDEKPTRSRRCTTGAASRRSSRTRASGSRPGSPTRPLGRLLSGNHLDDTGHYKHHHPEDDDEVAVEDEDEISDGSQLTEKETQDTEDLEVRDREVYEDLERGMSEEVYENRDGIEDIRDLEAGPRLERKRTTRSVREPNLVTWEGPDDPENPKNWALKKKWAATVIVSCFTFISPVSSSMVAPALTAIGADFHITNDLELALTLSIFVLAYAIGPLFLGPLSEIYGRVIVLQLSNLMYLFFNLGCGLAQTKGQMIAFRFLAGLGGSAPLALGGGVLSDLFVAEERGKAISIYSLAPLLGPAVGPIAGGFITENTTWRWVFHATTMADAVIQVMGLFFLQETYPPVLLQRKRDKLIKSTGNEHLHTEFDHPDRTVIKTLQVSLSRPFRLLGTQIIVQVLALYMGLIYGLMYLVLSTFPALWEKRYGESIGIGGLNYIALGIGFFMGAQICAPLQDRVYRILKKRNNGVGLPEFRVPLMVPGAVLIPIGLFWYGWTAQTHQHWILPNIGAAIFASGTIIGFQCMQTYIVDSYTRYAASAVGAATVLRSLAGFGFPLFATYMYAALDYGWGNSLLGFISIVVGLPAPILLWWYGAKLRARSTFAAG